MGIEVEEDKISAPEIEQFVLGGVIAGQIDLGIAAAQLQADDFTAATHKAVFEQLCRQHETGSAADIGTLAVCLKAHSAFAATPVISYLVTLRDHSTKVEGSTVESWFTILRDQSSRRKLIRIANQYIQRALSNDAVPELLGGLNDSLDEIANSQIVESDLQTPGEVIEEYGGVNHFFESNTAGMVATPWPALNYFLGGGYLPGEMVVLAARPAVGKSAHAMQQAVYSAFNGVGTVVFPLEMKARALLKRALAARAQVDGMDLKRGKALDYDQRVRLANAVHDFSDLDHLLISKSHSVTVGKIEASLRKAKSRGFPLKLCVIDYLQLIQCAVKKENRVQEISSITRALKLMAMELNIVVILLSQLSRDNVKEGRRPILTDLRESGTIEQDSDIVQFLHLPEQAQATAEVRVIEDILAKQREGPVDSFDLEYHAKFCEFKSLRLE